MWLRTPEELEDDDKCYVISAGWKNRFDFFSFRCCLHFPSILRWSLFFKKILFVCFRQSWPLTLCSKGWPRTTDLLNVPSKCRLQACTTAPSVWWLMSPPRTRDTRPALSTELYLNWKQFSQYSGSKIENTLAGLISFYSFLLSLKEHLKGW